MEYFTLFMYLMGGIGMMCLLEHDESPFSLSTRLFVTAIWPLYIFVAIVMAGADAIRKVIAR